MLCGFWWCFVTFAITDGSNLIDIKTYLVRKISFPNDRFSWCLCPLFSGIKFEFRKPTTIRCFVVKSSLLSWKQITYKTAFSCTNLMKIVVRRHNSRKAKAPPTHPAINGMKDSDEPVINNLFFFKCWFKFVLNPSLFMFTFCTLYIEII